MYRHTHRPLYILVPRMNTYRVLRIIFITTFFFCVSVQYLFSKLFTCNTNPVFDKTRLYPNMPLTINLRSYSLCHPDEFYSKNLISQYHHRYPNPDKQTCFLIESLDGGPWWSYVSHEFAEILTNLKRLGVESNITYQTFPNPTFDYKTNLTKYFLNACDIDETLPKEQQRPIVILLWDINRLLWYQMRRQWQKLLETTRMRLLVFIDDLHFTSQGIHSSRQFLFQSVASEILSTYPYLFHNYYTDIPANKITWLPHAASTLSKPEINQTAENVLFVSGANIIDWYPCRARAFALCHMRQKSVSCLKHPGYGQTMRSGNTFYYGGERYFSYMRKYIFGLATCQSVHYAIAKLFELPANGLALVSTNDLVPILESLHLYHNEHFLTVDCSSTASLKNELVRIQNLSKETIFQIREKSQEVVYQRHLTKHRAELLHVRLLSQALLASSTSAEENRQWEQWGRNCF